MEVHGEEPRKIVFMVLHGSIFCDKQCWQALEGEGVARLLIILGAVLIAIGVLVKLGVPLGRLPGDLVIQRGAGTFYFPIVTCLVISLVLSLLAMLFRR